MSLLIQADAIHGMTATFPLPPHDRSPPPAERTESPLDLDRLADADRPRSIIRLGRPRFFARPHGGFPISAEPARSPQCFLPFMRISRPRAALPEEAPRSRNRRSAPAMNTDIR
ncbi:hypothetical protein MCA1988 [Methylococcus capsulatus str. Bath]|uniref:Uncharacterized protein n=1 Tax=Methylococcus capsulatus (strain ATCC 33009 / NCIMB 11132 / Bath) TaxID=243233 RepID=Q606M8_METCA|nr:hypothetical protein MCA1988 [Methylococcus capsulatus str. Bath]